MQTMCCATILTRLQWRESRGCRPALRHSWNSKKQSQELKCYTHASYTSPVSLYTSQTLVSLAFFKLISFSLLIYALCHVTSVPFTSFPFWPFLLNSSHTFFPTSSKWEVRASFEYNNLYDPLSYWGVASFHSCAALVVVWDNLLKAH